MAEPARAAGKLESVRALIRAAQVRADRAGLLADGYQVLAGQAGNPNRELHRRMERVHRGAQQRHVAVVELHARYLDALASRQAAAAARSRFVDVLAERLGAPHLGVAWCAGGRWVAAAGATALVRAAQELEYTLAQGPMHDATHGVVHADTPAAIGQMWPGYGSALAALGARSVRAVPVSPDGVAMGALLVLDPPRTVTASALEQLAQEVALSLLLTIESAPPDDRGPGTHPALAEAGDWARIHQAAGIVSVRQRCTVRDALDLLRARAFADDVPAVRLAEQVIDHEARLD